MAEWEVPDKGQQVCAGIWTQTNGGRWQPPGGCEVHMQRWGHRRPCQVCGAPATGTATVPAAVDDTARVPSCGAPSHALADYRPEEQA